MDKLRILLFFTVFAAFVSCGSDDAPDNIEPRLYVVGAEGVTRTEATVTGGVEVQGGADVPRLWFAYGAGGSFDSVSPELSADVDGRVSYRLTGLTAGTEYSFRLCGDNGRVTLCSGVGGFSTMPNELPSVGDPVLLGHGPMSAIVGYEIVSDGGEAVTETGCYVTETGSTDTLKAVAVSVGGGSWRVYVDGLKRHSSYELCPYAVSRVGEGRGATLVYATADAVVTVEPGSLESLVGDGWDGFVSLSFAGPMNGDDLCVLRRMMGRDINGRPAGGSLAVVDMTDARIVAGGGSYDGSRYSADDVVGYGLFAGCGVSEVALPSTVKVVERDAFLDCGSLTELTIPASAEDVAPSAGCARLESVGVSAANVRYASVDGVLFDAEVTRLVWFPMGKTGGYVLPETVTAVGDYAFSGCSITGFTLPDGLEELGQGVFYGSLVEEAVMPASLRLLPTATFQACRRLRAVRLGAGLELVSDYAFDGCPLEHLYVEAVYPPVCNADAFATDYAELFSTCVLHVPQRSVGMYKADRSWGMFDNIVGM